MSEYYNVVPWYDAAEWHKVYEDMFSLKSSIEHKKQAHNLLLIWKARCPLLPAGIESTLGLIEVYIEDATENTNEQILRMAYSSALMRFVNHMLDIEIAKGTSLYQAARNLNVPDWIIDLRHDTAHHNKLPSIQLLREATNISLEWLKDNYWDKHKVYVLDYITGSNANVNTENDCKIFACMDLCLLLSICAHSSTKMKNLADVPDDSMRESIVVAMRDIFGKKLDMSNSKSVSIHNLIECLNVQGKKHLTGTNTHDIVTKALLGEDSPFLSEELFDLLGEEDLDVSNGFKKHSMQCFEVMLTFLHSNDLLLGFITELISITLKNELSPIKQRLAALWVAEILRALKRTKLLLERIKQSSAVSKERKKKELITLYKHWFPNEKQAPLFLDLAKEVPRDLTDINYINPIISAYNPYLSLFIKDLLYLVEPKLPKNTINSIFTLADLIAAPNKYTSKGSKIYTVDDVLVDSKAITLDSDIDIESVKGDISSNNIEDKSNLSVDETSDQLIWCKVSGDFLWSKCPIGILPWQLPSTEMDID